MAALGGGEGGRASRRAGRQGLLPLPLQLALLSLLLVLPSANASRILDAFGEVDALLPLDLGSPNSRDHENEIDDKDDDQERDRDGDADAVKSGGEERRVVQALFDSVSQGPFSALQQGSLQEALQDAYQQHEERGARQGAVDEDATARAVEDASEKLPKSAEQRVATYVVGSEVGLNCSDCEQSSSRQPRNAPESSLLQQQLAAPAPTPAPAAGAAAAALSLATGRAWTAPSAHSVSAGARREESPAVASDPPPAHASSVSLLASISGSSSAQWHSALQVFERLGLRSSVDYESRRSKVNDDLVLAALKADASYKQVDGSGGVCFVDEAGYSVGCAGSCGCSWFTSCYPKHASSSGGGQGQQVDVGLCSTSTPISIVLSTVFFFFMIIMIVALRMCLQWQDDFEDPLKEASPKRTPGKGAKLKVDATQRRRVSTNNSIRRASSSHSNEGNAASPVSPALADGPSSPSPH